MKKVNLSLGILVAAILVMASIGNNDNNKIHGAHAQAASKKVFGVGGGVDDNRRAIKAPIATSGDKNVYVTWWSNKTGNDEVMFKASNR